MSSEKNNSQNQKPNQNQQDIHDLVKNNFEKYFNQVEQAMPEYLQAFTKLEESFLDAWKNTINKTIASNKKILDENDIDSKIPKDLASVIQNVAEGYIKTKNVQNASTLTALNMASKNAQNYFSTFESVAEFNKKLLEYWANFYSNKN